MLQIIVIAAIVTTAVMNNYSFSMPAAVIVPYYGNIMLITDLLSQWLISL